MAEEGNGSWPLRGGFGDRHEVWEFVRSHAAAFGRPLIDGDGVDLTRSMHRLLRPYQLRIDPSGSVLVFRDECQGCTSWGVRLTELDLDDPPVVMELGDDWVPYSARLSLALAEMVLLESMFSEPDEGAVDSRDLDDMALGQLEAGFARLGLPDLPMAGPGGPRIRWFQGPADGSG